jgi:hypothetical protein
MKTIFGFDIRRCALVSTLIAAYACKSQGQGDAETKDVFVNRRAQAEGSKISTQQAFMVGQGMSGRLCLIEFPAEGGNGRLTGYKIDLIKGDRLVVAAGAGTFKDLRIEGKSNTDDFAGDYQYSTGGVLGNVAIAMTRGGGMRYWNDPGRNVAELSIGTTHPSVSIGWFGGSGSLRLTKMPLEQVNAECRIPDDLH